MKYWIAIQGSPKFVQHKRFIFAATFSFQFAAHEKQLQQVSLSWSKFYLFVKMYLK